MDAEEDDDEQEKEEEEPTRHRGTTFEDFSAPLLLPTRSVTPNRSRAEQSLLSFFFYLFLDRSQIGGPSVVGTNVERRETASPQLLHYRTAGCPVGVVCVYVLQLCGQDIVLRTPGPGAVSR